MDSECIMCVKCWIQTLKHDTFYQNVIKEKGLFQFFAISYAQLTMYVKKYEWKRENDFDGRFISWRPGRHHIAVQDGCLLERKKSVFPTCNQNILEFEGIHTCENIGNNPWKS